MIIRLFLNQNAVHQSLLKAFPFYTILCVKKIMVEIGAFVGQYFCKKVISGYTDISLNKLFKDPILCNIKRAI